MGSSKGRASGDRREHRKAAVVRRRATDMPSSLRVFTVDTPAGAHAQFGCVPVESPADLRPNAEERADANRHLIGAIAGVVAGLILVLVLGVGILMVARGG